ncbi:hypothetical protein AXG93_402s1120 [Marchantia polymorpha subsp. ruderalis]|uniref:Cation-transporting P-type ATPase N-terminal domain-containing protein n=1 Tax=Marchantia polymorpha subsp. ruderalis TaxID=1480154 RepID=A0A176WC85_MARPO|nr:hypothetical protein AXG93_402s1120 [Marchantia polymorpha subsp. ruderalis]
MDNAYARSVLEVLQYFRVDPSQGLSESQVLEYRAIHGQNGTPFWKLVLKQFDDLLVKILIAAAVVSFLLAIMNGDTGFTAIVEPSVILLILAANAAVGVITETNAEKALEELKAYQADVATVLRNGLWSILPASELVPGDLVEVAVGCQIPADMRLVEILGSQLRVDQAILTGESCSVGKSTEATASQKVVYQDKTNILFSGTVVTMGRGRAVVVGIGSRTAMGKIHDAMSQATEEMTPLKKKLDEFGSFLSKVIAVVCILVWIVNIGHFRDPAHGGIVRGAIYYFKIAVALAVAAIPEGLPAVVTTCLALGTKKMAKLNAIVRSLPSVETLGCTTVICSDKTGTLTTNMMSISKVCVVRSAHRGPIVAQYDVTGTTYAPDGIIRDSTGVQLEHPADLPCLLHLSMCSALCNDSKLQYNSEKGAYDKIGESTEVALRVLVEKVGLPGFDSMPSALTMLSKQERVSYCNNYWEQQFKKVFFHFFSNLLSVLNSYGQKETLRCLALALRPIPHGSQTMSYEDECNLTFVGVVGMLDPPREEVRQAIATCKSAGIRVIVVTGDNKATAESVCRLIGAFDPLDDLTGRSYTASEFEELPPMQQSLAIRKLVLFSRVEPAHKSMLVEALQLQNEVVAMTGDGVNDAPALKRANIGIAMGSGTAVAKGASDMVLADDNFSTIVAAVAEGRAIYNNTKQFIRYMVSSNIGEVVCIFLAAAVGMPETLVPVQLLWVNLVTDGLPATALGFNKQDHDVMMTRPRKMEEAIVNGWLFFRYVVIGVTMVTPSLRKTLVGLEFMDGTAYVGLATVGGFAWWFLFSEEGPKLTWAQLVSFDSCVEGQASYSCTIFQDRHPSTISMSVLVVVEMFNALNNLSENQSLLLHRYRGPNGKQYCGSLFL